MTAINVEVLEKILADVAEASPAKTIEGMKGVSWTLHQVRARIEAAAKVTAPQQSPVVRRSDPWSSRVGAAQIEPNRGTKKAAVLGLLRRADGGWVAGEAVTEVGGQEGTRRLRELRADDGWPIERRPDPTGVGRFQYRLAVPRG